MTSLASTPFDATILGYFVGGLVFIGIFTVVEWKQAEPMLKLSLLRIPTMAPSLLASFFQGLANYAVLFLVIMYLSLIHI